MTRALRGQSAEALCEGLQRLLVEGEEEWLKDWRDFLVALAPYHDCASRLGLDPAVLFSEVAEAGPPALKEVVREFGVRRDITPQEWGFAVADRPDGPRYEFGSGVDGPQNR